MVSRAGQAAVVYVTNHTTLRSDVTNDATVWNPAKWSPAWATRTLPSTHVQLRALRAAAGPPRRPVTRLPGAAAAAAPGRAVPMPRFGGPCSAMTTLFDSPARQEAGPRCPAPPVAGGGGCCRPLPDPGPGVDRGGLPGAGAGLHDALRQPAEQLPRCRPEHLDIRQLREDVHLAGIRPPGPELVRVRRRDVGRSASWSDSACRGSVARTNTPGKALRAGRRARADDHSRRSEHHRLEPAPLAGAGSAQRPAAHGGFACF